MGIADSCGATVASVDHRSARRLTSWRHKAAVQRFLSAVPGGYLLNYAFQRHVTQGVPIPAAELATAADLAARHARNLTDASGRDLAKSVFFEFGAGHDLHMALALWMLGADHQVVVDIRRLARPDLVADVARRLGRLEGGWHPVRALPPLRGALTPYLAALGIDYHAPCDARATGLPAESIDAVTSTNTLEHVPPDDIAAILCECHRILKPGGYMSFQIDYMDHYSYFDPSISVYNFLQFDERTWRRYNSRLHYQNRLRHSDYRSLLDRAGFEFVRVEVPEEDTLALLPLHIAEQFRDKDPRDLATPYGRFVLRKRATLDSGRQAPR